MPSGQPLTCLRSPFPTVDWHPRIRPRLLHHLEELAGDGEDRPREDNRFLRRHRHPMCDRGLQERSRAKVHITFPYPYPIFLDISYANTSSLALQASTNAHITRSRQVDAVEGEKVAHEHNAAWVETSAKNNVNVGQYIISSQAIVPPSSPATPRVSYPLCRTADPVRRQGV